MKRRILLLSLLVLSMAILSGCCLRHEWQEATCEAPKTCSKCEKTEGEALGHTWQAATCEQPEICTACGKTQGEALGHMWQDATCEAPKTCSGCAITEGEALGHSWMRGTCETPITCSVCAKTTGDVVHSIQWFDHSENAETGEITSSGGCVICDFETVETYPDWEAMALERIPGAWHLNTILDMYALTKYEIPDDMAEDTLYFDRNGTAVIVIGDTELKGTWSFLEVKLQDYESFAAALVWFDFSCDEGSTLFQYQSLTSAVCTDSDGILLGYQQADSPLNNQ